MSNPTDGHFIYEDISPDVGVGTYGPRLQQIASGGFSGVLNYSLLSTNTAGMIGYINYAYSLGLKVIVAIHTDQLWKFGHINWYTQLYADAGSPATLQAMAAYIVNQTKGLAGTWGWYVADEPGPTDAAALLSWCGYIRSADDTGKPRLIVEAWDDSTKDFWQGSSPWDSTYCEVGGDDFYALGDTRTVWPSTATIAAGIQSTCTARSIGSCMVLQAFSQTRYVPPLSARVTPFPAGAPFPSTLQMQQQKDACLRNMTPRLILWYSYQDIVGWTDKFTLLTSNLQVSTGYTQTFNDGGGAATWTWDTANARLVQTGGAEGVLVLNSILSADGYVETIMDEADTAAGLAARRVDGNNTYTLYLRDASNGGSPNSYQLEKIVAGAYTSLASGSLPVTWTRGVQHTFRLTASGTTISATMDGTSLASVTDSSITAPGKFGLIGGANARFYRVSIQPAGVNDPTTNFNHLANVVGSGLSHSLIDDAVLTLSPLRYYTLDDSTGFFAVDHGSQHQDGTFNNDGLGTGGSLVGVTQGQATITSIDGAVSTGFDGTAGYISIPTTGLPTGAQVWTLYAVVSMPGVQTGYKTILHMGQASLYYTTQYIAGGELIVSIQGVTDLEPSPNVTFVAGSVYHVGATYDGTNLRLYINGALRATQNVGVLSISYGNARVASDGNASDYNHCSVAKAVIDNKVWSAATFTQIYAAANKTFPSVKSLGSRRAFARVH